MRYYWLHWTKWQWYWFWHKICIKHCCRLNLAVGYVNTEWYCKECNVERAIQRTKADIQYQYRLEKILKRNCPKEKKGH